MDKKDEKRYSKDEKRCCKDESKKDKRWFNATNTHFFFVKRQDKRKATLCTEFLFGSVRSFLTICLKNCSTGVQKGV